MIVVGVKKWATWVALVLPLGAFLGLMAGRAIGMWLAAPSPPEPCRNMSEIRKASQTAWTCPPGADLETWPINYDQYLAKCICRTKP